MLKNILILFFLFLLSISASSAQGFIWGIKGGLVAATQKWDNSDRDILFGPVGILSIETLAESNEFSLFAQAGYHTRGSAIRIRRFVYNDFTTGQERTFNGSTTKYEFKNLALSAGAKQRFELGASSSQVFYMFGLRGEYHLSDNIGDFKEISDATRGAIPFVEAINDFTVGFIFGGGIEFSLSDYIGASIELTVNPDFTAQYSHPEIPNVFDPFTGGTRTLSARTIRNNTIELTVGFRFLREVVYVE